MVFRPQALKDSATLIEPAGRCSLPALRCKAIVRDKIGTLFGNEDGSVITWMAFGIVVMFGLATLTVDAGNFYVRQNQLQIAADTAVWGAVSLLPDEAAARAAALNYAALNLPAALQPARPTETDTPETVRCPAARPQSQQLWPANGG